MKTNHEVFASNGTDNNINSFESCFQAVNVGDISFCNCCPFLFELFHLFLLLVSLKSCRSNKYSDFFELLGVKKSVNDLEAKIPSCSCDKYCVERHEA